MWLKDPKDNKKSVSLTLLSISFLVLVVVMIFHILGKVKDTSIALELYFGCSAMYFGRRLDLNKIKIPLNKEDK